MTPPALALEVHALTKAFGGLRAVDQVSLQVPAGERRVLIGPNGAGKTTLFHCITGTLRPTAGTVTFFGRDVTRMAEHRRTGLGTALLTHAFAEFQRRGRLRAGLGVDAESTTGAVRLYERAGMSVQWRWDIWEREE